MKGQIKAPTFMQAVLIPFYPVPKEKGMEDVSAMNHPKLRTLKSEVYMASVFMFCVPMAVFFYIRTVYRELLAPQEDLYAGLAAVVAT